MKRTNNIVEPQWVRIVNREWKRAKRLLPKLKRKPTIVWATRGHIYNTVGSGVAGYCRPDKNYIAIHIAHRDKGMHQEFVLTLRHEFCHLLPTNDKIHHGPDFDWYLARLRGSRFASRLVTRRGT